VRIGSRRSQNAQLRGKTIVVEGDFSSEKVYLKQLGQFHLAHLRPGWQNLEMPPQLSEDSRYGVSLSRLGFGFLPGFGVCHHNVMISGHSCDQCIVSAFDRL
jgi:hypothetical protein